LPGSPAKPSAWVTRLRYLTVAERGVWVAASHRPSTGDGVVVLTDDPNGRTYCRSVVQRERSGDHTSLRVEQNQTWLELLI
jgi:hypothetical protein